MPRLVSGATPQALQACHLPPVSAQGAWLARTVWDRRFPRWVDQVLACSGSRVAAHASAAGLAARLSSLHGGLALSLPAATWPALEMAAALPEPALARDVVDALLGEPMAMLAEWLPGLALQAVQARPTEPAAVELRCGDFRLGLNAMDEGVARHLGQEMRRSVPADLAPLRGLRLRGRLRLHTRGVALADLASLQPGDVLVGGLQPADGRLACHFFIGQGTLMQATADTALDSRTATLSGAPVLAPDHDQALPLASGPLGAMELPVAFEIDSARLSLAELASFGAGSVITLEAAVRDARVRLVCCGQEVGVGQLVVVGDCLGVRIERMGLQAAPALLAQAQPHAPADGQSPPQAGDAPPDQPPLPQSELVHGEA